MQLSMRVLCLAFLTCVSQLHAQEPIIIPGGTSPSGEFAIAVYVDKSSGDLDLIDAPTPNVYLIDAKTKKRIGPLEEVDTSGAGWGSTASNVSAQWSPDSKYLIITFRAGKYMRCYELYQVKGRRAIPVGLPSAKTHPKGKILDVLTPSSKATGNLRFISNSIIVETTYPWLPAEGHEEENYSKFGLPDFNGELEFYYRLQKNGQWKFYDIRAPKEDR